MAVSALAGVRNRCETFFSQPDPGMPSSRLKANSIRPADATDERPQKHMAIAMPPPSMAARPASRFSFRVYRTAAPSPK